MPREFVAGSVYIVRSGDTLSGIASDHHVSLDALAAANVALVSDANMIRVGWELVIPGELAVAPHDPPAGATLQEYVVVGGDTLGALASSWGTTVSAIAELNGIANPNLLVVGQRLRRPAPAGASAPGSVVATAVSAPGDSGATASGSVAATAASAHGDTGATASRGVLRFARFPLDLPPARVTGGYREDYGGYLHRGIDIGGVPVGTPVLAPAPGIVTVHRPGDGWGNGTFGNCVILDHPGTPWWSIYAHLDFTSVADGDRVNVGDVLGGVGFTGKVVPSGPAGAHLHWQVSAHAWFPPDFEYTANPLDFLSI